MQDVTILLLGRVDISVDWILVTTTGMQQVTYVF